MPLRRITAGTVCAAAAATALPSQVSALDCRLAMDVERYRRGIGSPLLAEQPPAAGLARVDLLARLDADPDRPTAALLSAALIRAADPARAPQEPLTPGRQITPEAEIARILARTGCFTATPATGRRLSADPAEPRHASGEPGGGRSPGQRDLEATIWAIAGDGLPETLASLGAAALSVFALTLLAVAVRHSGTSGRRRHPRYPCDRPVTIAFGPASATADPLPARAIDISNEGMKIATPAEPGRGTRACVSILDERLAARVRWSNRFFVGVRFDAPLDDDAVRRLTTGAE